MNDASMSTCPECMSIITVGEVFCGECGTKCLDIAGVEGSDSGKETAIKTKGKVGAKFKQRNMRKSKNRLNRRIETGDNIRKKAIKEGRTAIMIVAVLTIGFSIFQWLSFSHEVAKIQSDPNMQLIPEAVRMTKLMIFSTFGSGILFIGLFFWAKKNPFSACLTALLFYILSHIVAAVISPETIHQGIIMKIFVIAALGKAISRAAELRAIESVKEED